MSLVPRSFLLLFSLLGRPEGHPTKADQVPLFKPHQTPLTTAPAHGAVASESRICSQIGVDLLKAGGNAVDAMIGTTLCVGVVGMYHSGIGGGGFMLVRDPDGDYHSVDFRETAPAAAQEDMYAGNTEGSVTGGLSVGVPGEVKGLAYIHARWGRLRWKEIFQPAVDLARDGFNVGEDLVSYMKYAIDWPAGIGEGGDGNFLVDDPVWAEDFAPQGRLLQDGEIMTRRRYANTLEKIGKLGQDAFYEGDIAQGMVRMVQETNGSMTLQDLKDYKVVVKPALNVTYRGLNLFSTGSPSSGAVMLSTLKTMEQYEVSDWDTDLGLTTHRFDEAMRFGYGARAELGDPQFVPHVDTLEMDMLSDASARKRKSKILDDTTQPVKNYNPSGNVLPESHGTSHIVTMDDGGMVVTLTTTVNLLFGARIMEPHSGIILNDEMNDFSLPGTSNEFGFPPSPANFIRPGKRPMSSITPIIAAHPNGTVVFATGAAGGSRIVSSTTQVVWHLVEHGDDLGQALERPRLHDQLVPNVTTFEYRFDNATVEELSSRGHKVAWVREGYSAVQAVGWVPGIRDVGSVGGELPDGGFVAVGEPRQRDSGGLVC